MSNFSFRKGRSPDPKPTSNVVHSAEPNINSSGLSNSSCSSTVNTANTATTTSSSSSTSSDSSGKVHHQKRNIFQHCINYHRNRSPNNNNRKSKGRSRSSNNENNSTNRRSLSCFECPMESSPHSRPSSRPLPTPPPLPPLSSSLITNQSSIGGEQPNNQNQSTDADEEHSLMARPNSVPPLVKLSNPTFNKITKPELEEAAKHAIGGGGGGNGGGNQAGNTQHNQLEISGVSKVLSVSKESGQRPLSSFEQPSPGVDTLEVCDKAAARLRELSQHLEHGEIPSSLLQKTLQYVACVLDTVSMDETRRRKLNQQPQPPPRRFSQTPSSSTTMTIDTSTTSTSTTMITTMPSLTSIVANIDSNKINQQKPIVPRRRISIETVNSSEASNHNNIIIHNNNRAHANHNNKTSKAENGDQGEATTKVPLCNKTITTPSTTTEESVKRVVITQVDPKAGENIDETVKTDTQDQLQRRLLDEEDELAEVQPDVVPSEVREWLASTFTKGPAAPKTRSDEKPKFRSVANAIRAGIMVDRIYRRLFNTCNINIPNNVAFFLRAVDEWSFDVFALNELCINKVLYNLSAELLSRYGLVHKFKITTNSLDSFLNQIESGYMIHGNPYHNNLHAADVTQTVHYLLWVTGLAQWLTDLEVFATLIAAIIHDFKHTGTTNNFHIMSGSEISLLYNDRSVLENYHISEAFKVMHNDGANIAQNLSREEYREFRTLIIEMVIATDMSTHFQQIKTLKTLLSHQEFSVDKQKGLSYILHTADISHPSKVFNLHQRWTLKLMEEFFLQGDSERNLGLPYSPLCDRNSTLIPQSQIGFIDFIVSPTMELCGDLIDRVHEHLTNQQQQSLSPVPPEMEIAAQAKTQQRSKSSMERPEPSVPGNFGPARLTSNLNVSRNTSSAPVHSRSSAPVISFKKLNRPWLKQLEENKGMWQMKATEEAKLMAEMAEKEKNEEQEKE